jgi:hypothetical protein
MKQLNLLITQEGDETPSDEVRQNRLHSLKVEVDELRGNAYMYFSSRLSMFDFARSLLQHALFEQGNLEFYPLDFGDGLECVNGVRLTEDSARFFVFCPNPPLIKSELKPWQTNVIRKE